MLPTRTIFAIAITAFLALALAACASATTPAPTVVPLPEATATRGPTRTPLPTQTPWPSLTPTPTATEPPAATPTATPDPALAQAELTALAWQANYDLLLAFTFPGPVRAEDYRVTLEDRAYECVVEAQFPNRLYCWGQGAKVLAKANIRVYPAGSAQAGFEKEVYVPYFDNSYNKYPR